MGTRGSEFSSKGLGDIFKLQLKKTRFSSRWSVDCFRLQMETHESEFSSKCLGDIFRLLIESYGSNLTVRKGPMDLFKLQIKKTRFSSRCPGDCFRLQMGTRESEFSLKCLGDIFRLLIESYDSNLTVRKGPLDLFSSLRCLK